MIYQLQQNFQSLIFFKLGKKNHEPFRSMGIDHSIKHQKISRVFLKATLHQSITLLEKKKGINNRMETMSIDRHIHSSKVVVNPHPLLMAHGLCMFMYRGLTW